MILGGIAVTSNFIAGNTVSGVFTGVIVGVSPFREFPAIITTDKRITFPVRSPGMVAANGV